VIWLCDLAFRQSGGYDLTYMILMRVVDIWYRGLIEVWRRNDMNGVCIDGCPSVHGGWVRRCKELVVCLPNLLCRTLQTAAGCF
jgi:hypothetical protein